ncbi:MAG: hypothetical protein Q8882_08945, partial [Bacillota bacterium]|nr:hypothetical protein [Bacillota bacterium]
SNTSGKTEVGGMPGGNMPGGMGSIGKDTDVIFEMSGGSVYALTSGDGIDINGSGVIKGGSITVYGPENDGNGSIDCAGSLKASGGSVIAAGSSGMAASPSGQNTIAVYTDTFSSGTVVITNSSGDELVRFTPEKKFGFICYSDSSIKTGETYTVTVGGTKVGSITASSIKSRNRIGFRAEIFRKKRQKHSEYVCIHEPFKTI